MGIFKHRNVGPTTLWQPDAKMFEKFADEAELTTYGLADLSGMRRSDVEFLLNVAGVPVDLYFRTVKIGDLRKAGLIPPADALKVKKIRTVSTARCDFCGRERPLRAISYDKNWKAYCNDNHNDTECHLKASL